jgi:hypothetical protein
VRLRGREQLAGEVHEQGNRAAGGDDRNGQPAEGVPDKDKGTVDLAQRASDDLSVIVDAGVRPVARQVDGNGLETATSAGLRLNRGQFAGGGPDVAAVHVVHDGGEGAWRVPGEPSHRIE